MKIVIRKTTEGRCGLCPFENDDEGCVLNLDETYRYSPKEGPLKNHKLKAHRPGAECPGPGIYELIKMGDEDEDS